MTFWIIRLIIVLIFFFFFLRRSSTVWGIGLLTVCLLMLLDALRTRGVLDGSGFLGWFAGGLLAAGGFYWLMGILRPQSAGGTFGRGPTRGRYNKPRAAVSQENTAYDRQMLYDQIRTNLGPEEVLDLIFDMGYNENDILNPEQPMTEVIVSLMDEAESEGKMGILAVTVERMLTPPLSNEIMRVETLSADTPPAQLREHLVLKYDVDELSMFAAQVGVSWDALGSDTKKSRTRRLLRHLQGRNQLPLLIDKLQAEASETATSETTG